MSHAVGTSTTCASLYFKELFLPTMHMHVTCSGYWHGHVQVRSRRVREVEDLIYFLDEVTTLSCIRHENIQLFMGACLSMQEGTLAIVMR